MSSRLQAQLDQLRRRLDQLPVPVNIQEDLMSRLSSRAVTEVDIGSLDRIAGPEFQLKTMLRAELAFATSMHLEPPPRVNRGLALAIMVATPPQMELHSDLDYSAYRPPKHFRPRDPTTYDGPPKDGKNFDDWVDYEWTRLLLDAPRLSAMREDLVRWRAKGWPVEALRRPSQRHMRSMKELLCTFTDDPSLYMRTFSNPSPMDLLYTDDEGNFRVAGVLEGAPLIR